MPDPDQDGTDGAPPSHIHIEKKKRNWVAWILLASGLLALLFLLSRCGRDEDAGRTGVVAPAAAPAAQDGAIVAETPNAAAPTPLAGASRLGSYLAGAEPTPRTFTFETLNFETSQSDIRSADREEIETIAATLKQYPDTRIRIAGYADARGDTPTNVVLGQARADSVKAALVAQGIEAGRIEAVSGGEADPVETNATSSGQAQNRRTELVVTQR